MTHNLSAWIPKIYPAAKPQIGLTCTCAKPGYLLNCVCTREAVRLACHARKRYYTALFSTPLSSEFIVLLLLLCTIFQFLFFFQFVRTRTSVKLFCSVHDDALLQLYSIVYPVRNIFASAVSAVRSTGRRKQG